MVLKKLERDNILYKIHCNSKYPMFLNKMSEAPLPDWFAHALNQKPELVTHAVAGTNIEILIWGERGKPGLLLLHGMMAHAHWWSYIAPFFLKDFRVAAISWSGMGGSGHRSSYAIDKFVEEARSCAHRAGLFDSAVAPRVVAHSFGAFVASRLAELYGNDFAGIVLLDIPLHRQPDAFRKVARVTRRPPDKHEARSLRHALARFRLRPEQSTDNKFIFDYIAHHSLKKVADKDTGGQQRSDQV